MIEKCLNCTHPGENCLTNLMKMSMPELARWCKMRKKALGMSVAKLSTLSGVPESTVERILDPEKTTDFRFSSIQPIVRVLTGCTSDDHECHEKSADTLRQETLIKEQKEKIHQLEEKMHHFESEIQLRDDSIRELKATNGAMKTLITNTNARHKEDKDFFKVQIKSKNTAIVTLSVCLGLCLLLIIGALIMDRLNSDMGFFWLESMFKPNGIEDLYQKWNM